MGYVYILLTIIFTVYGQLILKWRMSLKGAMPESIESKIIFLFRTFLDVWVLSGLFAAFLASVAWMATLSKFELSFAYPFMSLSFVVVFLLSAIFFQEPITWQKIVGLLLIIIGLIVITRK